MLCEEKKMPYGLHFSIIDRYFKFQLNRSAEEMGLTGIQLHVLSQIEFLEETMEEVRQTDLEAVCHMAHATLADILRRLERNGFITIEKSLSDKRSKCLKSTNKAADLPSFLEKADEDAFALICEGLTKEQVDSYISTTDILVANAIKLKEKGCMQSI